MRRIWQHLVTQEAIMLKIFLTSDPDTGRGFYDDEALFMGRFVSLHEAEAALGEILRFCSIRSDSQLTGLNTPL